MRFYYEGSNDLAENKEIDLDDRTAHRIRKVLRLKLGTCISLFNSYSGEFSARLNRLGRDRVTVILEKQTRTPQVQPSPWLLLPILKRDNLDWVIEKVTELGVDYIQPLRLTRTRSGHLRRERLIAISRAAAEQCGRLTLPNIMEPCTLDTVLATWDKKRSILIGHHCGQPAISAFSGLKASSVALLTGPEGGFSTEEESRLFTLPFIRPTILGPYTLRAETAPIAALAIFQALIGGVS